jgi:hypothetical protein
MEGKNNWNKFINPIVKKKDCYEMTSTWLSSGALKINETLTHWFFRIKVFVPTELWYENDYVSGKCQIEKERAAMSTQWEWWDEMVCLYGSMV